MSKRHLMQIRPRHGDGPAYSPQRDLAWIYAPAMKEALTALDQVKWTEEMAALIERLGVTEKQISIAVGKLTEAHRYIVNHSDVTEPVDALNKVGWYDIDAGVRYLIYGRLGEVMFGGFFIALRDTSELADESSQAREISELIAAGKLVMERGSGTVERRSGGVDELATLVHEAEAKLALTKDALAAAQEKLVQDAEETAILMKQARDAAEKRKAKYEDKIQVRNGMINAACQMGFWRCLWFSVQKPLTRKLWLTKTCGQAASSPSSEK